MKVVGQHCQQGSWLQGKYWKLYSQKMDYGLGEREKKDLYPSRKTYNSHSHET